jgi:hypothetical protein
MRWKIVLEGTDEFGSAHRSELAIDKDMERLSAGEIGWQGHHGSSPADGRQPAMRGYGKRKIRTVFGRVEVRNPRIMNCQRCLPPAWTVLRDICPDQATPELMERSAPRQPLAVPQSGGGDGRVPAYPINRVLCDAAAPHAETRTAPRREGS